MDRHNEILMDHILKDMAATTSQKDLGAKHGRKNDCYAFVSKFIDMNKEDEKLQNSTVRVYSLGGHLGHCILIGEDNEIVADAFKNHRIGYDKNNGEIAYNATSNGSASMGKGFKRDENSFEISVKDYLEVTDRIEELIEYKSNRDNDGKFVAMLNEGFSAGDALDLIKDCKPEIKNNSDFGNKLDNKSTSFKL